MVASEITTEVVKAGLSPEIRKELTRNGLWAILFVALLVFVFWTSQRREERLMQHQERMQAAQQQLVEEQRRLSDTITRVDAKVDKLIDRK
ncbi:MAG: BhlA/UviB family holin-like peptide [Armatimonadota bacterium]